MSVAIYHKQKISTKQHEKVVQREAKTANLYIEDVETKFEYALFNAPKEITYLELYNHFLEMWKRICKVIQKKNFQNIKININHFQNLYQPQV